MGLASIKSSGGSKRGLRQAFVEKYKSPHKEIIRLQHRAVDSHAHLRPKNETLTTSIPRREWNDARDGRQATWHEYQDCAASHFNLLTIDLRLANIVNSSTERVKRYAKPIG
jgi:hypothetical protein